VKTPVERQTYKIGEVAKLFGIGRNSAYEAAERGDFPAIRLGKRLVAPKAAIDRMLGIGEPPEAA
jgi:predicted DNA-binding transcriptional regulator AlpA